MPYVAKRFLESACAAVTNEAHKMKVGTRRNADVRRNGFTSIGTLPWKTSTIASATNVTARSTTATSALAIAFPKRIDAVGTGVDEWICASERTRSLSSDSVV